MLKAPEGQQEQEEAVENTFLEFVSRMIYSLSLPSVRLADLQSIPFKDLTGLVQRAYYQTKSDRGLTHKEIAKELKTSTRTVDRLAKATRQNFFTPEREHALPRRVEFLLWSGPKSAARLAQLLPDVDEASVAEALGTLMASGRVEEMPGRTVLYRETRRANRLPDDSMAARVDGLNNMLETIFETVWMRFFKTDPRAGARTVGLRVRREDLGEIERLYEETMWPVLLELDERARDAEDVVEVGMVMCWSPMGELKQNKKE